MFSSSEKAIFSYFDGYSQVWADPLRIWREMSAATKGNLNGTISEAKEKTPEKAFVAQALLVTAIRAVFLMPNINPTTGDGATEVQVWEAFDAFLEFMSKKKGSTETSLTSPLPMASPQDPSPMMPTSGCC